MPRFCIVFAAIFCLLCTISHGVTAQTRVLFQGSVMGYDGKPMKKAHIEMWQYKWGDRLAGTVDIAVSDKGTFLTKLRPGLYHIQFAGVDHAYSERRYLLIDPEIDCTVHARMERSSFLSLEDIDSLFVRYIDADDDDERVMVPMQRVDDGSFTAEIPYNNRQGMDYTYLGKRTPLRYWIAGLVPDRTVNGTDQDGFMYDGDGDFLSVKHADDSLVTIRFDYSALTGIADDPSTFDRPFTVSGAPINHPYAVLQRRLDAYREIGGGCGLPVADSGSLAWHAYRAQGIEPLRASGSGENAYNYKRRRNEEADSASVYAAEIELAKRGSDRSALECALLLYLNAVSPYELRWTENTLHENAEEVRALIRFAAETISPDSPIWNIKPLYGQFNGYSDSLRDAYALRVMREHPSPTAAFEAYELMKKRVMRDTTEARDERMDDLMTEAATLFKGTAVEQWFQLQGRTAADEARNRRELNLPLRASNLPLFLALPVDTSVVGQPMPAFRFAALRDSTQYLTNGDLAGKPFILVLGGVSMDNLASLEAMHDRYASAGLRIVRVWLYLKEWGRRYPSEESLMSLHERDGFSMPWTHVQAGYAEAEQLRITLKAYRSGLIFVGPDGSVLAANNQMEDVFMEYAVERFFEGELKP